MNCSHICGLYPFMERLLETLSGPNKKKALSLFFALKNTCSHSVFTLENYVANWRTSFHCLLFTAVWNFYKILIKRNSKKSSLKKNMYSYIFSSTHPVNSRTHVPPYKKLRRASVKHPPGALPYKLPPFSCTRPENASQGFPSPVTRNTTCLYFSKQRWRFSLHQVETENFNHHPSIALKQ